MDGAYERTARQAVGFPEDRKGAIAIPDHAGVGADPERALRIGQQYLHALVAQGGAGAQGAAEAAIAAGQGGPVTCSASVQVTTPAPVAPVAETLTLIRT